MANKYIAGIVWNKNFRNTQNYVFPQKGSVLKEIKILDFEIFWINTVNFLILTFCLFWFFLYLSVQYKSLGWFFELLSICIFLFLLFWLWLYILKNFIFMLMLLSKNNSFFDKTYIYINQIIVNIFKEKYKKIYPMWEWIYLIDKWKWEFKKVFYMPERLRFIKK